jgi:hypothetical protein
MRVDARDNCRLDEVVFARVAGQIAGNFTPVDASTYISRVTDKSLNPPDDVSSGSKWYELEKLHGAP